MGSAKSVATLVIVMGQIVEENSPPEFFGNPRSKCTRDSLSRILSH
jgi:ABC-type histidine transport system ATPase subunit